MEHKADREATFDDFVKALPESEARFGVYDLEWKSDDHRNIRKVIYVVYIPDGTKVAEKFKYSNGKAVFKSKIGHTNKDLTINDRLDLTEKYFIDQF